MREERQPNTASTAAAPYGTTAHAWCTELTLVGGIDAASVSLVALRLVVLPVTASAVEVARMSTISGEMMGVIPMMMLRVPEEGFEIDPGGGSVVVMPSTCLAVRAIRVCWGLLVGCPIALVTPTLAGRRARRTPRRIITQRRMERRMENKRESYYYLESN